MRRSRFRKGSWIRPSCCRPSSSEQRAADSNQPVSIAGNDLRCRDQRTGCSERDSHGDEDERKTRNEGERVAKDKLSVDRGTVDGDARNVSEIERNEREARRVR